MELIGFEKSEFTVVRYLQLFGWFTHTYHEHKAENSPLDTKRKNQK